MTDPAQPLPVHLLELPVALAAKTQQHFEELMREFSFVAASAHGAQPEHHVPARLMQLVDALTQQFSGITSDAEQRLADAIDRGDAVIADHQLDIPAAAGPASRALGDLIDEADDYCRSGQHLLTLASPPDCVAYRRWYLSEVIGQLAGAAPTPWPQSEHARALHA